MDIENDSQSQKYKELGNQSYKNKDYPKAIAYYTKAIQINSKDPNFYTNRALCSFNLNKFQDCIKDCNRALGINSNLTKALKKKWQAYVNLLKFDQAVEAAKLANTIDRNVASNNDLEEVESLKSNFDRYEAAQKSKDYAQALSCINHLVNKIPNNKSLKMVKVECLAKTGKTVQAGQLLGTMNNQTAPDYYYLKGIIQLYNGDSAKAKRFFAEGIRMDPQNLKCQKALSRAKKCETFKEEGNDLIKQKKYKEAEMKYTEALNLDPYNKKLNSIIYSNRALTYMKRSEKVKALQDLNKSLELDPNYMKSLIRRAELNMERQDYTAALSDYSKMQQLDPNIDLKSKMAEARKKQKLAKKKDYYGILGITRTATDADIKKAYKALALKYHPDRNRSKTDVEQLEASKKFQDISEANTVLTNPEKKKLYDSGQMQYEGDQGSGYENMGGNMGNMGGMHFGNMGGQGSNFSYNVNGQDMGGAGGMDPNQIFKMFFNSGSGFGAFENMAGNRRAGNPSANSKQKGPKGFGNFGM